MLLGPAAPLRKLEDKVNAYLGVLAKPYEFVRSAAAIDTDVANESQLTDVPEQVGRDDGRVVLNLRQWDRPLSTSRGRSHPRR